MIESELGPGLLGGGADSGSRENLSVDLRIQDRAGVEELRSAVRHDCFVQLEIDHHSRIRELYGQEALDAVLQAVSVRLLHRLRASDIVVQRGGGFIVSLTALSAPDDIEQVAEDLVVVVEAGVYDAHGHYVHLTATASIPAPGSEPSSPAGLRPNPFETVAQMTTQS